VTHVTRNQPLSGKLRIQDSGRKGPEIKETNNLISGPTPSGLKEERQGNYENKGVTERKKTKTPRVKKHFNLEKKVEKRGASISLQKASAQTKWELP